MIRFYFHPTPNPAKIALFLEEAGLAYETIPVDTSKGEQHARDFRAINPNGKVPGDRRHRWAGRQGGPRLRFRPRSCSISPRRPGKFLGTPEDRPELLSWLLFIASGLGPFSGQAVHFQFAAPEGLGLRGEPLPARSRATLPGARTTISPAASSSSATATRSPTCRPGDGWTVRRACMKGEDDPLAALSEPEASVSRRSMHGRRLHERAPSARITTSRRLPTRRASAPCSRRTIRE